jgi:hypothetical protein
LQGSKGNDVLNGGSGSDRLDRDKGNDLITTGGVVIFSSSALKKGWILSLIISQRDRIFLGRFSSDRLTLSQSDGGTLLQARRMELLFLEGVNANSIYPARLYHPGQLVWAISCVMNAVSGCKLKFPYHQASTPVFIELFAS